MSSNKSLINRGRDFPGGATSSHMQRSVAMDPLFGVGNLSTLNPGNRVQGPPLSPAYLQHPTNYGTTSSNPPPLPRRDSYMTRPGYSGFNGYSGINSYSGMNSYYSPFSSRRYSPGLYSSGMYSPYSNYRTPYGPYGAPNDPCDSFLQMAEESTRPAFESIESVVQVVNSISMMLESTYGAVHSSYSAILGVVSQFSHLKSHLTEIFSILTMLKGLQWLCLKVLYLLGLRKTNPSVEEAWKTARNAVASGDLPPEARGSAWPFFMFLSLVIGAPWLMFKLLSKNATKKAFDPGMWTTPDGKRYIGYGGYDFNASQPGELSFRAGEKLILSPKYMNGNKNWLLACNEQKESGLVPKNYLMIRSGSGQNNAQNIREAKNTTARNRLPPTSAVSEQYIRSYGAVAPGLANQLKVDNNSHPIAVPPLDCPNGETEAQSPNAVATDYQPSLESTSSSDKDSVSIPNYNSLKKNLILPEDLNFSEVSDPAKDNDLHKAD